MDYKEPASKRPKKKDKAREKVAQNGHFSAKHIRLAEQLKKKS